VFDYKPDLLTATRTPSDIMVCSMQNTADRDVQVL
jgi:hypothetical protein